MEVEIKRGRGRPKGSGNKPTPKLHVAPSLDSTPVSGIEEEVPIRMPKTPRIEPHRLKRGYLAPWKQLEETAALLPDTVMARISTQHEIDLIVQRVQQLLDKVEPGESGDTWRSLKMQMLAMEKARKGGDESEFWDGWSSLVSLVAFGDAEAQTWKEIYEAIEVLRRLKETELKRHAQEVTSMAREEVIAVILDQQKMFQYAVIGEIKDTALQSRVLARYQEFIDRKFNVAGAISAYSQGTEDHGAIIEAEYTEE